MAGLGLESGLVLGQLLELGFMVRVCDSWLSATFARVRVSRMTMVRVMVRVTVRVA